MSKSIAVHSLHKINYAPFGATYEQFINITDAIEAYAFDGYGSDYHIDRNRQTIDVDKNILTDIVNESETYARNASKETLSNIKKILDLADKDNDYVYIDFWD